MKIIGLILIFVMMIVAMTIESNIARLTLLAALAFIAFIVGLGGNR